MTVLRSSGLLVLVLVAYVGAKPAPDSSQAAAAARCELPEPTVLRREGNAVLHVWELPAAPVWFGEAVPDAPGYLAYRAAIRAAGGDQARPVADPPQPKDDAERDVWRREDLNGDHDFSDPSLPVLSQSRTSKGVVIGDGVWIGAGAKVLDGVAIGEHEVIGAGAVVRDTIPPHAVAVGVPARVVSSRVRPGA